MTPEQKTAIAAKLGADLATIASDRLIELALLHRAAPTAQPDFPNRLQAEIARRFTADAIAQARRRPIPPPPVARTLSGVPQPWIWTPVHRRESAASGIRHTIGRAAPRGSGRPRRRGSGNGRRDPPSPPSHARALPGGVPWRP